MVLHFKHMFSWEEVCTCPTKTGLWPYVEKHQQQHMALNSSEALMSASGAAAVGQQILAGPFTCTVSVPPLHTCQEQCYRAMLRIRENSASPDTDNGRSRHC